MVPKLTGGENLNGWICTTPRARVKAIRGKGGSGEEKLLRLIVDRNRPKVMEFLTFNKCFEVNADWSSIKKDLVRLLVPLAVLGELAAKARANARRQVPTESVQVFSNEYSMLINAIPSEMPQNLDDWATTFREALLPDIQ